VLIGGSEGIKFMDSSNNRQLSIVFLQESDHSGLYLIDKDYNKIACICTTSS